MNFACHPAAAATALAVRSVRAATAALLPIAIGATMAFAVPSAAAAADGKPDFSVAERALFMEDQFGNVRPPATLRYRFAKSGSLEPGFDDQVTVALRPQADGSCCAAVGQFLSGARNVPLPDIEAARGNPVTMYFLERDVREMQRLTTGKSNHFRKQIRMAIFEGASVRDVTLPYRGKAVAGREIAISPYLTDPNRPRFQKYAAKQYVFLLSPSVPGGVYGIRTRIADSGAGADAAPLIAEEMLIDGADAAPPAVKR